MVVSKKARGAEALILMYHEIMDKKRLGESEKFTQFSYILEEELFRREIEYLKKSDYNCVNINEFGEIIGKEQKCLETKKINYIIISFDDGFMGNYEKAFPILLDNGLVGNFFLITGEIEKKGMMTWEQIKEMSRYGMHFGSHTMSHAPLGSMNQEEIFYELDYSRKEIEDKIGLQVSYLSLPHGSFNQFYKPMAIKAKYLGGCTSIPGINDCSMDPFLLRRMGIQGNKTFDYFVGVCKKRKKIYHQAIVKNKIIGMIKKIVGDSLYLGTYNKVYGIKENQ